MLRVDTLSAYVCIQEKPKPVGLSEPTRTVLLFPNQALAVTHFLQENPNFSAKIEPDVFVFKNTERAVLIEGESCVIIPAGKIEQFCGQIREAIAKMEK